MAGSSKKRSGAKKSGASKKSGAKKKPAAKNGKGKSSQSGVGPVGNASPIASHTNDLSQLGPRGSVQSDAWIHPTATVIGNVVLGPECSIWPSAVLRGDLGTITLGRGVNIQDGTVVHCDSGGSVVVGDYTLVGHRAILHGCKVGRGALIGINSVILDGAEIGDGAMITAGCMIRGGMKIPPLAMVVQKGGELKVFPGKARAQITVAASLEYIELARRWQERVFRPLTEEEEKQLSERASTILKEMFSG